MEMGGVVGAVNIIVFYCVIFLDMIDRDGLTATLSNGLFCSTMYGSVRGYQVESQRVVLGKLFALDVRCHRVDKCMYP